MGLISMMATQEQSVTGRFMRSQYSLKENTILVTFDSSGKEGKVSKTVTLTANTIPNTKVITITAEILVP